MQQSPALKDLLRHQMRNPDAAAIFDRALTVLITDLERQKLAATERPREAHSRCKQSRHIPASVRRAVWARDGGRCRFEGPSGRCTETGLIEFHHVVPYAHGGPATVDNLELRCAAHNRYEASQSLGLFVRETGQEYEGERRTALFARDGAIDCDDECVTAGDFWRTLAEPLGHPSCQSQAPALARDNRYPLSSGYLDGP